MGKINPGTIYEIKLEKNKYVYLCRLDELKFGLFNIISEKQIDIKTLENNIIIDLKGCNLLDYDDEGIKKLSINQCGLKKIGEIDLNKIKIPDIAFYDSWNPELSYNDCLILRDGSLIIKVELDKYKKLIEKGLIFGIIPSCKIFKKYITRNIDNIIKNLPMDSSWDTTRFHD